MRQLHPAKSLYNSRCKRFYFRGHCRPYGRCRPPLTNDWHCRPLFFMKEPDDLPRSAMCWLSLCQNKVQSGVSYEAMNEPIYTGRVRLDSLRLYRRAILRVGIASCEITITRFHPLFSPVSGYCSLPLSCLRACRFRTRIYSRVFIVIDRTYTGARMPVSRHPCVCEKQMQIALSESDTTT